MYFGTTELGQEGATATDNWEFYAYTLTYVYMYVYTCMYVCILETQEIKE